MRLALIIAFIFISNQILFGQNTFRGVIIDHESREPLPGATVVVRDTTLGTTANETGYVEIQNLPDGEHKIDISLLVIKRRLSRSPFLTALTRRSKFRSKIPMKSLKK